MKVKRDSFLYIEYAGNMRYVGSRQKLRSYDAIIMQPDLRVCRA